MINAGIIGITGYVGVELLRLLQDHPEVNVAAGFADVSAGREMLELYPHLNGSPPLTTQVVDIKAITDSCDLVFMALPHGKAADIVQPLLAAGKKVIDLGADFRIQDPLLYEQYYQTKPANLALLKQAVYGLPETGNKDDIANASLIANPGCYPTASILAAMPLLKANIIDTDFCIFDAKSGISGAGKMPSERTHYCEIADSVIPYQISGTHRHTPEIEQALSGFAQKPMTIQFTPHLIPIIRGLLVTAYFKLKQSITAKEVVQLYQDTYQQQPFIRITEKKTPHIKHVRGTNYCDIGFQIDTRSQYVTVVSVIDNLMKGAAGQAIQNMNLMYQLPETMGLLNVAAYP